MKKTKLDLYRSAEAAALDSLKLNGDHAIHSFALTTFNREGFAPADWQFWNQTFNHQRQLFENLAKQAAATVTPVATASAAPAATKTAKA